MTAVVGCATNFLSLVAVVLAVGAGAAVAGSANPGSAGVTPAFSSESANLSVPADVRALTAAARGNDRRASSLENGPIGLPASLHTAQERPQSCSLAAQNLADIPLWNAPPWWTPLRILAAVGAALAAALTALWLRTQRRWREECHDREKARALFAAVLGERNRMAGEIHDTLAQGFAAISVQLEALGDRLGPMPDDTSRHLDLARQLVRQGLTEARRTVWALRAQALEEGSLGDALAQIGRQLTEGSPIGFASRGSGTPRPLPAKVENTLLRVGQEALTNAVRHAGARQLALALDFQETAICLTVSDDGQGQDPATGPQGSPGGGFGLSGMRERANAIGAELHIRSAPNSGTTIELIVHHV